jgi:hypothetical protein
MRQGLEDFRRIKYGATPGSNGPPIVERPREIPEAMKPRSIPINGASSSNVAQIEEGRLIIGGLAHQPAARHSPNSSLNDDRTRRRCIRL